MIYTRRVPYISAKRQWPGCGARRSLQLRRAPQSLHSEHRGATALTVWKDHGVPSVGLRSAKFREITLWSMTGNTDTVSRFRKRWTLERQIDTPEAQQNARDWRDRGYWRFVDIGVVGLPPIVTTCFHLPKYKLPLSFSTASLSLTTGIYNVRGQTWTSADGRSRVEAEASDAHAEEPLQLATERSRKLVLD